MNDIKEKDYRTWICKNIDELLHCCKRILIYEGATRLGYITAFEAINRYEWTVSVHYEKYGNRTTSLPIPIEEEDVAQLVYTYCTTTENIPRKIVLTGGKNLI